MSTSKTYTIKNVSISYAAFGGGSYDCKQGIAEDGCTVEMAEDFGERTMGADGSTLWSEYETKNGTVTLNVMANSPVYAYFVSLNNAQRLAGTKGQDSMTIKNRSFSEQFSCADVAIQSISGETYDKAGHTVRVITLSCGTIDRFAA